VGKVWVLDTETKGTGANMVPLDQVQKPAEPGPARTRRRQGQSEPRTEPRRRPRKAAVREASSTDLPPGHVRKKATGEIGRIEAVDAKAGTARVRWLKRGASSTVPLSAISRR
jgi:hypothetical protein